nr:DUF6801 domain-containing protein [Kibdelosporangium sp. MJ126-NF4]CEL14333.1 Chitinase [Kibdelosporangium sp. MJ126-NF4]CTQ88700.1 Chitinase (EC 3.2.1.14) [Kibdelosporangium sp. MJ126-NF4]
MKNRNGSIRVALAAASTAALAATTMLVGAGTSAADPASLTLNYKCAFPLIGGQPIEISIELDLPKTVAVGAEVPATAIKTVSKVGKNATAGLNLMGAKTLEGTALAGAAIAAPEAELPLEVPATLEKTPIPASGEFSVVATGETPPITFTQAGTAKITVGEVNLHLVPRKADGSLTPLKEFDSKCTQEPNQNNELTTIEITPAAEGVRR